MTTLVANEIRKLRTIRGPWLLLAAGPVLVIVGVAGELAGADLTQPQTAIHAVAHAGVMSLLTLILGITAVAGEYRHKTITDTYLATPRRGRVIAAKFAVYAAVGAVFGVVLAITAVIATAVAITANGGALDLSNSDLWRTLVGGVACNAAFTAVGVSLGALIPNLAAAIATALAWIALVEGLIGELITEDLRRGQRAAPADRQQRRRKVLDQLGDFGFQFVDLGGEGAAVPHQGACESGDGAAQSAQPSLDLVVGACSRSVVVRWPGHASRSRRPTGRRAARSWRSWGKRRRPAR